MMTPLHLLKGAVRLTRLYHEIIKDIPSSLQELDENLKLSTDHCLLSLSARSISKPFKEIASEIKNYSAAVVFGELPLI